MVDERFSDGDRELYFYLNGRSGSFTTKLFDAIILADSSNRMKLKQVFPEEVEAVEKLQNDAEFHSQLHNAMTLR